MMISTQEKMRMFTELAEVVFKINEREGRNAFIDFHGHVNQISVRVHTNGSYALGDEGTDAYRKDLIDTYFYLDRDDTVEEFERIREELRNV